MTTSTTPTTLNGIDVQALKQLIGSVAADRKAGDTRWAVTTIWAGGTRSESHVEGFEMGGQHVNRPFTLRIDEPMQLGGTNTAANPQEYLLSALNACMMVGYVAGATLFGIELTHLEIETTGDINLRGFLGVDPKVPNGYEELNYTVRIAGNGTPEQFQKLHAMVQATSPNYWNVSRPIKLNAELKIQ